jgi:hypothetical protein
VPEGGTLPGRTTTTVATTTTTLVPSIAGRLPATQVTLPPFVIKTPSAHVDPDLAKISLGGLALALLIMVVQFVLPRPGRGGRRTL